MQRGVLPIKDNRLSGKDIYKKRNAAWFVVIALAILSISVFLMTSFSSNDKPSDWIVFLPA